MYLFEARKNNKIKGNSWKLYKSKLIVLLNVLLENVQKLYKKIRLNTKSQIQTTSR